MICHNNVEPKRFKFFICGNLFLIFLHFAAPVWACHKGIGLDGHKAVFAGNLTTVSTEQTTGNFSTSTKCDWYADLLQLQHGTIEEQIAQGQGEELELVLAKYGCQERHHAAAIEQLRLQFSYSADSSRLNQSSTKAIVPVTFATPIKNNFDFSFLAQLCKSSSFF